MGGYRRPLCFRTVCSCLLQNHLVRLWCVYTTPLELTLPKISEKIQSLRPAAVPPSGTASQKIAFTFFILRAVTLHTSQNLLVFSDISSAQL